jgi:hypothetical protein
MEDLEACIAMDRDPEVTRFLPSPWADRIAHRAFVEERMRHSYPLGMGYWSMKAPEGFVRWVLLTPLDCTDLRLRSDGVSPARRGAWAM